LICISKNDKPKKLFFFDFRKKNFTRGVQKIADMFATTRVFFTPSLS